MKNTILLTPGQTVWVHFTNSRCEPLRPMQVAKVGSKWAQLTDPLAPYRQHYRLPLVPGAPKGEAFRTLDGGDYASPGTAYSSEQEQADQSRLENAWNEFRRYVSQHYGVPDLAVEQVQYMHRIIDQASE